MVETDNGAAAPTARLLWAACRPEPDVAEVLAALDDGADASWAAAVAVEGRTGPLLWRTMEELGRLDDFGPDRELLHKEHETRRVQAALLLPIAVQTALGPLLEAGMEPVVFKGPAIAVRYPSPGLRPMDDIDVLLPPEQHARGKQALERAGWSALDREGRHHDTVLLHPHVPDLALELHLGLESWRDQAHHLTSGD